MTCLVESVAPQLRALAPPGSRIVVATSGGPDSLALLDVIASLRDELQLSALWAVGVDHGLRADASRELDLAAELCENLHLPFVRVAVSVATQGNLMANARRARYAALREQARALGATRIAVGHTATDQVETVLLRLTRGAALGGAAGMRPRRGIIIRPLLFTSRNLVMQHLETRHIGYASDPTNLDTRFSRPRVRHQVLPILRELNPELERSFVQFSRRAAADEALLDHMAHRAMKHRRGPLGSLRADALAKLPEPVLSRVLRNWLGRHGLRVQGALVRRAQRLALGAGPAFTAGGAKITKERGHLWVMPRAAHAADSELIPGESVHLEPLRVTVQSDIVEDEPGAIITNPTTQRAMAGASDQVAFDLDRLHFGLRVRCFRPGDRIRPYGLRGRVKVGDLFTNKKIPRPLRRVWPLVVAGDEVIWVAGLLRSDHSPVTEKTRRVINLRLVGALEWSAW